MQRSKRSGLRKSLEQTVGLPSIFQVEDIYSQILQLAEVCLCGECLCCRMQGPSRHKELHIHHHGHAFTFIALSSPRMLSLCLSSWQPLHYLPQPLPHAQNGVEDIPKTPGQTQLLPCHRSFFWGIKNSSVTWCQFLKPNANSGTWFWNGSSQNEFQCIGILPLLSLNPPVGLKPKLNFSMALLTVRWSLQSCDKELLQNVCTIWIHGCTWHCKQQISSIIIMQVQRTICSYDPETQQRIGVVRELLQKKLAFSIFLILTVESLNSLLQESWSSNVVCDCKSPLAHTRVAANYSLVGRTNSSSKSPVASFSSSSSYHP